MPCHRKFLIVALAVSSALLSACAGSPPTSDHAMAEDVLRDTDRDVLFAAEFPVANKAEAISRAETARQSGEIDKALFFYVKALKFDPQDADLLAAIGRLHQYQGNAELAVRAYSMALEVRPKDAMLLEARGLILLKHDEAERAFDDLNSAVAINANAWQAYNGLGLLANERGNHSEAIAHFDMALRINPDAGPVLNNRGYAKMLAYDYIGARTDLSRAARDLGYRQAWMNLGALYGKLGLFDQAVDAYSEVLPAPDALNKTAEASMRDGDYATAQTLLKKAISLSPTYFPEAEENLLEAQAKLGQR